MKNINISLTNSCLKLTNNINIYNSLILHIKTFQKRSSQFKMAAVSRMASAIKLLRWQLRPSTMYALVSRSREVERFQLKCSQCCPTLVNSRLVWWWTSFAIHLAFACVFIPNVLYCYIKQYIFVIICVK